MISPERTICSDKYMPLMLLKVFQTAKDCGGIVPSSRYTDDIPLCEEMRMEVSGRNGVWLVVALGKRCGKHVVQHSQSGGFP